jgi:large subunit ribosomal protein L25
VRTNITVTGEVRDTRGKNAARRTRRAGMIPAVVYGAFQDAVAIAVDPRRVSQILRSKTGYNTIFDLQLEGHQTAPVMLVDHQNDPVKGNLLHADLKRIDLTKRLRVAVPVMTTGEPFGVKVEGGLLEPVTRALEIECLPDDIPEHFTIDVSDLKMGQARRASELPIPASIKLLSAPDAVLAHVVALRGEVAAAATEEAAAPAAAATAEPEVIKKGKKEEAAEAEKGEKGKKK